MEGFFFFAVWWRGPPPPNYGEDQCPWQDRQELFAATRRLALALGFALTQKDA
jgi:hypothetical protein